MKIAAGIVVGAFFILVTHSMVVTIAWWFPFVAYGGSLLLTASIMVLCGVDRNHLKGPR